MSGVITKLVYFEAAKTAGTVFDGAQVKRTDRTVHDKLDLGYAVVKIVECEREDGKRSLRKEAYAFAASEGRAKTIAAALQATV